VGEIEEEEIEHGREYMGHSKQHFGDMTKFKRDKPRRKKIQ